MHTDSLNQPLEVGDTVVYSTADSSGVFYDKITGITPKKVQIGMFKSIKEPKAIIKINAQVDLIKEKHPEYLV